MKLDQVRTIAKARGIQPGKLSKAELIKSIQTDEGNFNCYSTAASSDCDQVNCLWREDCLDADQRAVAI